MKQNYANLIVLEMGSYLNNLIFQNIPNRSDNNYDGYRRCTSLAPAERQFGWSPICPTQQYECIKLDISPKVDKFLNKKA